MHVYYHLTSSVGVNWVQELPQSVKEENHGENTETRSLCYRHTEHPHVLLQLQLWFYMRFPVTSGPEIMWNELSHHYYSTERTIWIKF